MITNNEGTAYVGAAFTFTARESNRTLHAWGLNSQGQLGQGDVVDIATSIGQIPGTNWVHIDGGSKSGSPQVGVKADGTLWGWGNNDYGMLAQNNVVQYSSPVQIPGDWKTGSGTDTGRTIAAGSYNSLALKPQ